MNSNIVQRLVKNYLNTDNNNRVRFSRMEWNGMEWNEMKPKP